MSDFEFPGNFTETLASRTGCTDRSHLFRIAAHCWPTSQLSAPSLGPLQSSEHQLAMAVIAVHLAFVILWWHSVQSVTRLVSSSVPPCLRGTKWWCCRSSVEPQATHTGDLHRKPL